MNPQTNGKSREDYLAMLDDIAKLKKKTGLSIASDQSGVVPEVLGSAPAQPGTVAYGTPIQSQFPKLQDRTYNPPTGSMNDGQNYDSNQMNYQDFINSLNANKLDPNSTPYGGYSSPEEVYQKTGLAYALQTLQDGGVLYNDGSIKYQDGTIREGQNIDPGAYGVESLPDGTVKYSDGSIKRPAMSSQESLSQEVVNPQYFQDFAGIGGLSNFIFGKEDPVTQDYGNYNPNKFYTYHQGIDFGTIGNSDVIKLPTDVQVVEVNKWDGLPPDQTQTPYGNSILIRLGNGQMLRLSHLDQLSNLQPGDMIKANEVFATPGATGNTTAEHLDVEFYNAQGQIDNPKNFFVEMQKASAQPTEPTEPIQSTPTDTPTPTTPPVDNSPLNVGDVANSIKQAPTDIANTIDTLNPTGTNFDLGATEALRGNLPEAGAKLGQTIENVKPTGNFDLGISEALKNDPQGSEFARNQTLSDVRGGIGNVFSNIGKGLNLKDRGISEIIAGLNPIKSVQAAEMGGPANPLQSRQDILDTALNAAGQGINKLKNVFSGVSSNFVGNNMADLDTRKIGGSPASLPTDSMMTPKDKFQSTQGGMNNVFKSVATPTQSTSVAKSTSSNVSSNNNQNRSSSNNNNNNQSSNNNNNNNNNNSNQNRNSTPAPAPQYQSKAPTPQYQTKAPTPQYQTPAPKPAPKPAPAPAPKQNVFTNLVNTIKSWFKW